MNNHYFSTIVSNILISSGILSITNINDPSLPTILDIHNSQCVFRQRLSQHVDGMDGEPHRHTVVPQRLHLLLWFQAGAGVQVPWSVALVGVPKRSTLVCRYSGEVMDDDNAPLVLPNGQVY